MIYDESNYAAAALAEFGEGAYVARSYSGNCIIGNGLGECGYGRTWEEAAACLRYKHRARLDRQARSEAPVRRPWPLPALLWWALAVAAALALWLAWR